MCEWGPSIHVSRKVCLEGCTTGVSVALRVGVLGRHGERDGSSVLEAAPFAVRIQSKADREALGWGLLAWEDPRRTDGPASPFWARAPMLEGECGREAPPPARLVENAGARLSALRLADGTLILKIEKRSAAAQVRMRPEPAHARTGL